MRPHRISIGQSSLSLLVSQFLNFLRKDLNILVALRKEILWFLIFGGLVLIFVKNLLDTSDFLVILHDLIAE